MNVLVIFCSRFILHDCGLMGLQLEKCKNVDFGRCPRTYCSGQPCLPMGQSDVSRTSTVKIYCPKCEDIYYPRSKYQGSILFHMDCLLLCHVMWQSIGVCCGNNQFPHFLGHSLIMLRHHVCIVTAVAWHSWNCGTSIILRGILTLVGFLLEYGILHCCHLPQFHKSHCV
jgi:hypothetical protein